MKIKMIPNLSQGGNNPSGISRVVEAYYKYLPMFGVEFTDGDDYDLSVVHAGVTGANCDVAVLHGIYFTADYESSGYEYKSNEKIVRALRSAKQITVPSYWVSEILQRDMRITPSVVPHGIDSKLWEHDKPNAGYALYNKNRDAMDVCDSKHLVALAKLRKDIPFLSTFSKTALPNIKVTGVQPHEIMKDMVQRANVYLSLTKETFGIGALESLASGVPVLGFRYGGNVDTITHGVTGYLANPYDYDDLANGLDYCIKYRDILSANCFELIKAWTWEKAVEKLYHVLESAMVLEKDTVSVIIPTFNYANKVGRAIESCEKQIKKPDEIIVVDDGSTDNTEEVVNDIISNSTSNIKYFKKSNGGVATARNYGFEQSTGKYVCFLDADDEIAPKFLDVCVDYLEKNRSISLVYTSLMYVNGDNRSVSQWPGVYDYDAQLRRKNQVPTCNVARRELWSRLAGQRQRYAPNGAGSEDADMWTRAGAYGMDARKITEEPLFIYHGGGRTSVDYREVDWLGWHPWATDNLHPFASLALAQRVSHPVRQYDQPAISVIIPVGKGHEELVIDALDSLDAQSFRNWEAIVVWDSPNPIPHLIKVGFPHVRFFVNEKSGVGPGVSRNIGVKQSRGKLILFLDADDYLIPGRSLSKMYTEWQLSNSIVYSDYLGISITTDDDLIKFGDRVVSYNKRTHEVISTFKSAPYDCELAQQQPNERMYHWCLVTCLIPKEFHNAIGGFDESMKSWEDVDYHWRMARKGYCYSRIQEPLIMYRFTTGSRRELASAYNNKDAGIELIKYMSDKYKGVPNMPCPGGCGNRSSFVQNVSSEQSARVDIKDDELVMIRLIDPNKGDHSIIGPISRQNYGYRSSGDTFLVKGVDAASAPHMFLILNTDGSSMSKQVVEKPKEPVLVKQPEVVSKPVAVASEIKAQFRVAELSPVTVVEPPVIQKRYEFVDAVEPEKDFTDYSQYSDEPMDLQLIPGISLTHASRLKDLSINSKRRVMKLGVEGLIEIKGIGITRAEVAIKYIKENPR